MTYVHYYLNRARLAITAEVTGRDDQHTYVSGADFNRLAAIARTYASDLERIDFLRHEWIELNGGEA